jgi:4'-phosphopantetheinyl transferase
MGAHPAEEFADQYDHTWQHRTAHALLEWAQAQPENQELPYYNITHSGRLVAAALSQHPVGVDGEMPRRMSERIAKRVLTEAERSFLDRSSERERTLLQLWTLKESYGKALGVGIAYPMKDITLVPCREEMAGPWQRVYCSNQHAAVFTRETQEYVLSLCVMGEEQEEPALIVLQKRTFL